MPTSDADRAARREAGEAVRNRILGDGWTGSSHASPGLASFTEMAIDIIWAGEWVDPTLPLREKSLITLSAMVSLGHTTLVEFHTAGALRVGTLTAEEIRRVITHLNPYVGYPVARAAMIAADKAIAEHEAAAAGSDS